MTTLLVQYMVFSASVLIWLFTPTGAFPQSGFGLRGNRTRRDVHCRQHQEYLNGNICCLNCPAGTRMVSPCTTAGVKGTCEECDDGTFTEHSNNFKQCFKCTQCRSDQEIVRPCTHTHDTECQCKLGRFFCDPDQACEVCKKCSRCEKDEETVRNCTSTANTVCKKIQPTSGSALAAAVIVPLLVVTTFVVSGVCMWKRRRATDSHRSPNELKVGPPYSDNCPTEEERNAQPQLSLSSLILSRQLENEPFPKLVPVNGEESLRKCFEYFEEMDIDYYKRFFRNLGINDNVIKSNEGLNYDDKVHELLNIWVEKEGREASLNDLLKALLDLNQRRTAEIIMEKAIHNGHYFSQD